MIQTIHITRIEKNQDKYLHLPLIPTFPHDHILLNLQLPHPNSSFSLPQPVKMPVSNKLTFLKVYSKMASKQISNYPTLALPLSEAKNILILLNFTSSFTCFLRDLASFWAIDCIKKLSLATQ